MAMHSSDYHFLSRRAERERTIYASKHLFMELYILTYSVAHCQQGASGNGSHDTLHAHSVPS